MDSRDLSRNDAAHAPRSTVGGKTMKRMAGTRIKRTFGIFTVVATLLFGSAVAKADVVLDWNVIAVNTAIANGQNPIRTGALRGYRATCRVRSGQRHTG